MSIITKPTTIYKNMVAEFILNKSVLSAITSVVADSYFSDSQNWSEVLIYYKSSEGNQREILKFDATQASPTANFLVSDKARDIFQVQKIMIKDFDNGSFTVERTELVAAEFDVDMSGGGSGGGSGVSLSGWSSDIEGFTATSNSLQSSAGLWINIISDYTFSGSGNWSVEATIPNVTGSNNVAFGFQNSSTPATSNTFTIDYGFYILESEGQKYVIPIAMDLNGTLVQLGATLFTPNDVLKITRSGAGDSVSFYQNGQLLLSFNPTTDSAALIAQYQDFGFSITNMVPISNSYKVGVTLIGSVSLQNITVSVE